MAKKEEEQYKMMEEWFRERYEDPAHNTGYNGAEGGYQWNNGGPFTARDVLETEFTGRVPEGVIAKLVEELDRECWQWAPKYSPDDEKDDDDFPTSGGGEPSPSAKNKPVGKANKLGLRREIVKRTNYKHKWSSHKAYWDFVISLPA